MAHEEDFNINIAIKGADTAGAEVDRVSKKLDDVSDKQVNAGDREEKVHGKQVGILGKVDAAVDKVTVRKKQLISTMNALTSSGGDVVSMIGGMTANLGAYGLAAGGAIMIVANLAQQMIASAEASKKQAAAFIQSSDAMKQMGYGAIGYAAAIDEIIKKQEQIGRGLALSGGGGVLGTTAEGVRKGLERDMIVQLEAEGKSRSEITAALKNNKDKLDQSAEYIVAQSEQQRRYQDVKERNIFQQIQDTVMMKDAIGTSLALKTAEGALVTATAQQQDSMSALNIATKDLTNKEDALTGALDGMVKDWQARQGQFALGMGIASPEFKQGLFGRIGKQYAKPEGGGGAAKMKVSVPVPGGAEPLIPELPGYETELGRAAWGTPGVQQAKQAGGVKKAIDNFGRDLAETTANQVANGLVQAFQAEEPKDALKSLFMTVLNSLFSAGIGRIIGMAFGAPALHTGGYYSNGTWKSFAGGGDIGSWVDTPMGILGSRGNALVGDTPEIVQNIPQLQRMMGMMQAQGGDKYYVQTPGVIGAGDIAETVRSNYVAGERSHKKASRG